MLEESDQERQIPVIPGQEPQISVIPGQEPQIPVIPGQEPQIPVIPIPVHKIVVVGSAGVGKTALVLQFMYNVFEDEYVPTESGEYRKKVFLDESEVDIIIYDTGTAGREENPDLLSDTIRRGDGFLCVFSLLDEDSFEATQDFRAQILRVRSVNIPFILVGNKCDLKEIRKVSPEAVTKKKIQWDVPYVETSAKTDQNVEKVFFDLARKIAARKLAPTLPPKPTKDEEHPEKPLCPCPCCEIS